ncbi:MAG: hypothetical protein ACYTF7_01040 [Planctomycetota bacterium]|jgi:hypothetical protein
MMWMLAQDSFREAVDRGYYGSTTVHPLALVLTMAAGISLFMLPRRYALWPLLVVAVFISTAQRVVIADIDLTLLRILTLFGFARVIARGEIARLQFKGIDYAFCVWLFLGYAVFLIRDPSEFVYRSGWVFDGVGLYFLFRCLVQKWTDIDRAIQAFIVLSVPIMIAFVIEQTTRQNMFSVFGGVPSLTMVRDGRVRCQGAFSHPIMAGTFWAAMLPLVGAWCFRNKNTFFQASIGVFCSLVIVAMCASSGPVVSVMIGALGMAMFTMRHWMGHVRWAVLGGLTMVHLLMEAPVWHLVARIDIVGGSTGYHRYKLIDEAINNFGDWWLIGVDPSELVGWETNMSDVTNQYVFEGINGGVWTLLAFIAMLWLCFAGVGRLWRMCDQDAFRTKMAWALGASMLVHTITFLSVSYFGQMDVVWFLTLAMVASMSPTRSQYLGHVRALAQQKRASRQRSSEAEEDRGGLVPA